MIETSTKMVFALTDAAGRALGRVYAEQVSPFVSGVFEPGAEYGQIERLFRHLASAIDEQILPLVEEAEQIIARLGLRIISDTDPTKALPVWDVQIYPDGGFSCRLPAERDERDRASAKERRNVPSALRNGGHALILFADEIEVLPRWAKVLYAVRCAQRFNGLEPRVGYRRIWLGSREEADIWNITRRELLRIAPKAIEFAAQAAAGHFEIEELTDYSRRLEPIRVEHTGVEDSLFLRLAALTIWAAQQAANEVIAQRELDTLDPVKQFVGYNWAVYQSHHAKSNLTKAVVEIAHLSVDTLYRNATLDNSLMMLLPRLDFDRLIQLSVEHGWTDETPIASDPFGSMWPSELVPWWVQLK